MKVVWLIQNLVPYHHARAEAFADLPDDVELFVVQVTDRDAFKVLEFKPEEASYALQTLFAGRERESISTLELEEAYLALLDRLQPDCICASGWGLAIGQVALMAASLRKLPVILCSDSNAFDEARVWYKEYFKRGVVAACSAFFVAGHSAESYIQRLGGGSCVLGYDVTDNAHFERTAERPEQIPQGLEGTEWFLVCARFEAKKNLIGLLEAYALYLEQCRREETKPARLVLAGDGMMRAEIEETIRTLELGTMVILLGAVSYTGLPWLYQKCMAFVQASTTEQWGLVVNEAMAAGAPVLISNRCGCAPDLVAEGENGYTFDPRDTEAMAAVLWKFHALPERVKQGFHEKSRSIIADWGPDRFARGMVAAARQASAAGPRPMRWVTKRLLEQFIKRG